MHFNLKKLSRYWLVILELIRRGYVALEKYIVAILPREINQNISDKTFSSEGLERLAAIGLDLFISAILTLFPIGGWYLAVGYILVKDALPIFDGQSVGKHFFGLRVVKQQSMRPITRNYKKSSIRGVVLLIPFLNIYDLYYYLVNGYRKADVWAGTVVIKDRYFTSSDKGSEI